MNPRSLPEATWDVIDIADWYDQQSPGLGTRFRSRLDALVARLCVQPRMYARIRGAPRGREIRVALMNGFPFLVHYEVTATEVVILSVVHARSRNRPWRHRLDP